MAEAIFMYAVTAGIFVFLAAILFGARAKRYKSGWSENEVTSSSTHKESNT